MFFSLFFFLFFFLGSLTIININMLNFFYKYFLLIIKVICKRYYSYY